MEWISVDDRLPEPESTVLVFDTWVGTKGNVHKDVFTGYWSPYSCGWKVHYPGEEDDAINVTHWMPLPGTPE